MAEDPYGIGVVEGTLPFRGSVNPTDCCCSAHPLPFLWHPSASPAFYINSQATRRGGGWVLPHFYLFLHVLGLEEGTCQNNFPASACKGVMLVVQVSVRPQVEAVVASLFLLSFPAWEKWSQVLYSFLQWTNEEGSWIGTVIPFIKAQQQSPGESSKQGKQFLGQELI